MESEELEDLMGVGPIDRHLVEERESGALSHSRKGLDLLARAGLLRAKLVAGEGKDLETLLLILLVESLKLCVGLLREPAPGGDVHDEEQLLAFDKFTKGLDLTAVDIRDWDVQERLVGSEASLWDIVILGDVLLLVWHCRLLGRGLLFGSRRLLLGCDRLLLDRLGLDVLGDHSLGWLGSLIKLL